MTNLIKGHRIRLIKKILNNDLIKYFRTSRLNGWPKKPKTSDLEIAIKCNKERRQRDVVIVSFLLDY